MEEVVQQSIIGEEIPYDEIIIYLTLYTLDFDLLNMTSLVNTFPFRCARTYLEHGHIIPRAGTDRYWQLVTNENYCASEHYIWFNWTS